MVLFAEQELQGVLPRRQRHVGLGLPGPKTQMVEVIGDRLVERRQLGVDQQMMVPRVRPVGPGRRYSHTAQTEMDRGLRGERGAVLEIDEMDRGARR